MFTGADDISKTDRLDCLEIGSSRSDYPHSSFPSLVLFWLVLSLFHFSLHLSLFLWLQLAFAASLAPLTLFFLLPLLSSYFPFQCLPFFLSFYISSAFIFFFVCKPGIPDHRECSRSSARENECTKNERERERRAWKRIYPNIEGSYIRKLHVDAVAQFKCFRWLRIAGKWKLLNFSRIKPNSHLSRDCDGWVLVYLYIDSNLL